MNISEGVREIQKIFDRLHSKYMLMNGNIEKNLKFFVGSCCEDLNKDFSYVMDKRLERHEIDMIGFINGEAIFATEFKCTFTYDKNSSNKAAVNASKQIKKTLEIERLKKSKKQIVHFLNYSKGNSTFSLAPKWIKDKYPKESPFEISDVIKIYVEELVDSFHDYEIIPFKFDCPDLGLKALIIDVKNGKN